MSNAGLEHIQSLTNLKELSLTGTKVTAAGVKKLAAALPQCKIAWDGNEIPIQPTGDSPPTKNVFAGKLAFHDMFDDAKSCTLFQGTRDGERFTVENGSYNLDVVDGKASAVATAAVGTATTDMAFATRMRATNSASQVAFRIHVAKMRGNWLLVRISPTGRWSVLRVDMEQLDGKRMDKVTVLAESAQDDPELAVGKWVNVAGRSVNEAYEVWVNGKSVARGADASATSESNESMAAVQFAGVVAADGPNNVSLDYAAVWDFSGSPDPKAAQ